MWQLPSLLSVAGHGIDVDNVCGRTHAGTSNACLRALGKAGNTLKPDCCISSVSSDGPWFSLGLMHLSQQHSSKANST